MPRVLPRYSDAERAIIIEQVKLYPDNLREAFRKAATLLPERNQYTIANYYHRKIRNSSTTVNTTGSAIGFTKNRKNNPVKQGETFQRAEPLQPVLVIMRDMLTLSVEDRRAIRQFLNHIDK